MTTTCERWFFYPASPHGDPRGTPLVVDDLLGEDGFTFMGYESIGGVLQYPVIEVGRRHLVGRLLSATLDDTVVCTSGGCQRARFAICVCSCGGENHGVAWKKIKEEAT